MSGENCFQILNKIFKAKNNQEIEQIKGYTIKYGYIIDNNNIIDEVLVSYFKAPKSYTTENMCEINSHGGIIIEKMILEECIKNGAILAEPGEFTKRAFLNGRIDLSQAEAVMDMINAKTEKEVNASIKHLEGKLSEKINEIQDDLLDIMADIDASIDYPEYDIEETTNIKLMKILKKTENKLIALRDSYNNGRILKEGIKTLIIGKPNVGKSSLLNLMLNEERAIVSDIEGTTRDTIEEYINLNGVPLKIIDTAGIRQTNDEIEKIGVKKTIDNINNVDLIIALFDDSREFEKEDEEILKLIENKKSIILINKIDLGEGKIKEHLNLDNKKIIPFSTTKEIGLNELYDEILKMFNMNEIELNDGLMISNFRQKQHIDKAIEILNQTVEIIKKNETVDISAIYIKEILEELGTVTGQAVSENIINEIFSKFCLGK